MTTYNQFSGQESCDVLGQSQAREACRWADEWTSGKSLFSPSLMVFFNLAHLKHQHQKC